MENKATRAAICLASFSLGKNTKWFSFFTMALQKFIQQLCTLLTDIPKMSPITLYSAADAKQYSATATRLFNGITSREAKGLGDKSVLTRSTIY